MFAGLEEQVLRALVDTVAPGWTSEPERTKISGEGDEAEQVMRRLLQLSELSQVGIAKRVGVSKYAVQDWLTGRKRKKNITLKNFVRFVVAAGGKVLVEYPR